MSALLAALVAGGLFDGGAAEDRFAGGWHWEAVAFPLAEGVIAVCVSLWAIGFFRRRANHLNPLARLMSPFAYGAFVVHPPVIVGLALAIGPLPLPAEAKFVAVLVAGIAGSFAVAALPRATRGLIQTQDRVQRKGWRVGEAESG